VSDNPETETPAPVEAETAAPVEAETAAPVEAEAAAPTEPETAAPVEADWRADMHGGDEDIQKAIARYQSPKGVAKALRAAQVKLSQSTASAVPVLAENPTDEQVAEYRQIMGVPSEMGGYIEELPDGVVIGDEDRPLVDSYLQAAHNANIPKQYTDVAMAWLHEQNVQKAQDIKTLRAASVNAADEVLREEWGPEYETNKLAMDNTLDQVAIGLL